MNVRIKICEEKRPQSLERIGDEYHFFTHQIGSQDEPWEWVAKKVSYDQVILFMVDPDDSDKRQVIGERSPRKWASLDGAQLGALSIHDAII